MVLPLPLPLLTLAVCSVDGYWTGVMSGQGWVFDDVRGLE